MTKTRKERNEKIKREVLAELETGLFLKEACYIVAERYWLSMRRVQNIYYDTRLPD